MIVAELAGDAIMEGDEVEEGPASPGRSCCAARCRPDALSVAMWEPFNVSMSRA